MTNDSVNMEYDGQAQLLIAAALVYVAKGDGQISDSESRKMLGLLEEHLGLSSGDALTLLTEAIELLNEDPDVEDAHGASARLNDYQREDIILMLLKVVAADGRPDAEEMESLSVVAEVLKAPAEVMRRAYERYFAETWHGDL